MTYLAGMALSDTLKTQKSAIRKAALAARDATDPAWRIEVAIGLVDHADALAIEAGQIVSGFMPIRSEIDIRPLMFALGAAGARLCVPVVMDKETIVFRHLVRGAPLVETGFGTFGPGPEAEELDPDVMLVPLAAFDNAGNRIGYGAGYYDRAIARLRDKGKQPRLIGCAFECQCVDDVPVDGHDVPLHTVLTETGLHALPRRG